MERKNELRKNNKGFSLVELIVVIAIMAVLVAVIAPQLLKYVEKSRQSTDIQTIDNVASALQTYYADDDTRTADIKVTVSKTKIGDSNPAIKDANLQEAVLKGKWKEDKVEITLDTKGNIKVSGSSDYYVYDGNGSTAKKAGSSSNSNTDNKTD